MTCSSDNSCAVTDYMTCWEKLEAMSDASYDSYGGVDEEWCAWNDVEDITLHSHRMWRAFYSVRNCFLR